MAADLVVDMTEIVPPLGVMAGFAFVLPALQLSRTDKSPKLTLVPKPLYEIRW